jgi:uncharacterized protein YbaA (DUF1428 family)
MAKAKGTYVDGFVLVVPKDKRAAYKKMAEEAKHSWLKRGALDYKECRLEHAKPKWVTFTFPKMVKAKKSEEVWFSYVVYRNKKHRDTVNKAVEKEMIEWQKKKGLSKKETMAMMPFDMKRMAYGGFKVEVNS